MRALVLSCLLAAAAAAQSPDPTQQLVESLYPKNQRLKEIRMGELVRHLNIHAGSTVADVGCGGGEFSVILSRVVGPSGKVWCEDIHPRAAEVKRKHTKNVAI